MSNARLARGSYDCRAYMAVADTYAALEGIPTARLFDRVHSDAKDAAAVHRARAAAIREIAATQPGTSIATLAHFWGYPEAVIRQVLQRG